MISDLDNDSQVPPPDPPDWAVGLATSLSLAADLAEVPLARAQELVDRQIVQIERICGEDHVRVDHLIAAAAAPALPPGVVHVRDAFAEWKQQHPLFARLQPDDAIGGEGEQ
jgi:hypothetical protein